MTLERELQQLLADRAELVAIVKRFMLLSHDEQGPEWADTRKRAARLIEKIESRPQQ